MKIVSIVGARPQFIKEFLLSRKLREKSIKEVLIHTGQHYDFNMSGTFFQELNILKPDYHFATGSGLHGEQTGKMIMEIERALLKESPSMVLVYGDTNTTLAGALAASKLHIPVAHVEAGLRSFNKKMPEEINRVVTDHISDILFCPTETAVNNLRKEGLTNIITNEKFAESFHSTPAPIPFPIVAHVGDVMFDVALEIKKKVDENEVLKRFKLSPKDYILTTIHRAENTDEKKKLENIFRGLKKIAKKGIKVFLPLHPRTKKALKKYGLLNCPVPDDLILNEPVSYGDIVVLENNSRVIITDSGGVQKEGYFFRVPGIIVRDETEWVELVKTGWNILTGADENKMVEAAIELWERDLDIEWEDFYGGGKASDRIAEVLIRYG